ncbi:hypothetical protein K466DRAFT_581811 [Polyporus arcularius HHB13444]|uniref:Uncharacterized protein n=1 Tax=Polyporus arcularius HHB13444 TaxID=1314778 RepID=A0A5C3PVJ4_9APHY|nr:hypothetical protein K466DRAFT_581811 [Polyporus arcularius HHB13444]
MTVVVLDHAHNSAHPLQRLPETATLLVLHSLRLFQLQCCGHRTDPKVQDHLMEPDTALGASQSAPSYRLHKLQQLWPSPPARHACTMYNQDTQVRAPRDFAPAVCTRSRAERREQFRFDRQICAADF